eukprot:TRINITY_DN582_c0_g1_i2.p1 TRINITY_DN582_c0_g1~~TRINITY_DN582_c0_g1_i2.p1  ORF type:complete len:258 (+),score=56.05 TRINITY_DN582_c0_g1_i2:753-1526(+)
MRSKIFDKKDVALIKKHQSKVNFTLQRLDIENSVILYKRQNTVKLNKPIYTGCTVLDYSKVIMGKFFYNDLVPHYGRDNVELLYTDTDSFILSIKPSGCVKHEQPMTLEESLMHNDFYLEHMDTSDYPKAHPLHSDKNKKALGYFKNEYPTDKLVGFCGLQSKVYAIQTESEAEYVKLKGVNRRQVKKNIHFDNLMACLDGSVPTTMVTSNSIRAKDHKLYTMSQDKKALTAFDDKRRVFEDGTTEAHRPSLARLSA